MSTTTATTRDPDASVEAPVEAGRAVAWRAAVLALRYGERRRVFPTTVHVGDPSGTTATFALPSHRRRGDPGLDHGLRCDVVGALVDRARRHGADPAVWLTRSGPLGPHDQDAAWLSAAATACAEAGVGLDFAVVTHHGWYDPRTGAARSWKRLRRR